MATRVGGRLDWLWCAVDEYGQALDVRLQNCRDTAAAERFLRGLLVATGGTAQARFGTDELGSYAAPLAHWPELAGVEFGQNGAARRRNS